eukprot:CAMPEP_0175266814 /NCGR_PEP_ID=MMETSP0093-20121207/43527_1 /TAXON_ID=311494 /ORGANISM="Alexandrium monilatum, Strain CCMP3105" /LENGTH=65 /DNA_ID=CAMNT_0016561431 /DNA_START=150 /DNA_END=343 /DNA_ORIENTATION=-
MPLPPHGADLADACAAVVSRDALTELVAFKRGLIGRARLWYLAAPPWVGGRTRAGRGEMCREVRE